MNPPIPLKRELGLLEVTLSGTGIILGAGIYVLIGEAAALAGNAIWLSFAFAALIAVFTGLSYAELTSMFPTAGAEHDYVAHAFHQRLAFIIGIMVILSGVVGAATVSLGFASYFTLYVTFLVINAAVIALRLHSPQLPRPFRIPLSLVGIPVTPVLGALVCVFFLFELTLHTLLIGAALLAITLGVSYLTLQKKD